MIIRHDDVCQNCGFRASNHTSGVFWLGFDLGKCIGNGKIERGEAPLEEIWDNQLTFTLDRCKKFKPNNLKYLERIYESKLPL